MLPTPCKHLRALTVLQVVRRALEGAECVEQCEGLGGVLLFGCCYLGCSGEGMQWRGHAVGGAGYLGCSGEGMQAADSL